MKLQIIASLAILGSLIACSTKGGAQDSGRSLETKTVTINGEKPTDYFKKFNYTAVGKCSDKGGVWFHFLSSYQDSIQLPDAPDGRYRRATLSLYLQDDGTYVADYVRELITKTTPEATFWDVTAKNRLSGKANIDEHGKMVLENLGILSALTFNGSPAAMLSMENTELTEGIANTNVIMQKVESTSGREPYNVVCPGSY